MNVGQYKTPWKRGWLGTTLSVTLALFHGALAIAIMLIMTLTR